MSPISPLALVGTLAGGAAALANAAVKDNSFLSFLNPPQGKADEAATDLASPPDWSAKLDAIAQKLRQRLAAAGVDLSTPVSLSPGLSGEIEANSDHPQWREIEEALRNSPDLSAELSSLLAAAERSTDDLSPHAQVTLRPDQDALFIDDRLLGSAAPKPASLLGS